MSTSLLHSLCVVMVSWRREKSVMAKTSEMSLAPNIMETCGFISFIEDDNHSDSILYSGYVFSALRYIGSPKCSASCQLDMSNCQPLTVSPSISHFTFQKIHFKYMCIPKLSLCNLKNCSPFYSFWCLPQVTKLME